MEVASFFVFMLKIKLLTLVFCLGFQSLEVKGDLFLTVSDTNCGLVKIHLNKEHNNDYAWKVFEKMLFCVSYEPCLCLDASKYKQKSIHERSSFVIKGHHKTLSNRYLFKV